MPYAFPQVLHFVYATLSHPLLTTSLPSSFRLGPGELWSASWAGQSVRKTIDDGWCCGMGDDRRRLVTPMLEGWQRCSGTARRTKLPPQSKSHRVSLRADRVVCVSRGTLSPPPPPSSRRHYIYIYMYINVHIYTYMYIYVTKSTCVRVLRARERARASRLLAWPIHLPVCLHSPPV